MHHGKRAKSHSLSRGVRPTPNYNDRVTEDFIARQDAHIKSSLPANFELTPISGDAW